MVDLPKVPRRLVTTEAPNPNLTAETVASPYSNLGKALSSLGEGLDDVAVVVAREGAQNAVTKDENGNLQVQTMPPMLGRAGQVWNRVAKAAYVAQVDPKIQDEVFKKRLEMRGSPQEFQDWGARYVDELATGQPDKAVSDAVRELGQRHVGEAYRHLAIERQTLDLNNAFSSLKNRLGQLDNEMGALARQGGTDTSEYQQRRSDIAAIYHELSANPLFEFSKERADSEGATMEARHHAEAVIGMTERLYDKQGRAAARQFLEKSIWDPSFNLTEAQRNQYVSRGLAALEARTATQQAAIHAHRELVTSQIKLLETGGHYDARQLNDVRDQTIRLGDGESVYKLDAAEFYNKNLRAFRSSSNGEQFQILTTLQRSRLLPAPAELNDDQQRHYSIVVDEARRQGVDPNLAAAIAWQESKFNPKARPMRADGTPDPNATQRGMFQMTVANRAKLGVTEDAAPDIQAKGGVTFLKAVIGEMKQTLGRDPTPAEIYAGYFLGSPTAKALLGADREADLRATLDAARPGYRNDRGQTWGEAIGSANEWMAQYRTVGDLRDWSERIISGALNTVSAHAAGPIAGVFAPANPAIGTAKTKLIAEFEREMSARLDGMVDNVIEGMRKRELVTSGELGTIVDWVQQTGNFAAGRKLADFLETHDRGALLQGLPDASRQSVLGLLRTKAATDGIGAAERKFLDVVEEQARLASDGMKRFPLLEGSIRGWVQPPGVLDLSDPANAAGELQARNRNAGIIRARDPELGPLPLLGEQEAAALKSRLTQGDARTAATTLNVLFQSAAPDNYRATMALQPVREALDGMVRSYDPIRITAAMSTLDYLYRTDPVGFAGTFGADTFKRLQLWQGWKDTYNAAEIAERFKRADDPAMADARKHLAREADDELRSYKARDVVTTLYAADHPVLAKLPFMGPSAPADGGQRALLMVEFGNVYRELRQLGLDADQARGQAVNRLRQVWGRSDTVNGDTLMRYPPERYYEAVDGKRSWMRKAIEGDIAKEIGRPMMAVDPFSGQEMVAWTYRVGSDATTEADIGAGRKPSYFVTVTDARTGRTELWLDDRQEARRYRWDASPSLEEARTNFNERRNAILEGREHIR